MGGLTPHAIATQWTIPQLAVLVLDRKETGTRDPFKPGPGEHIATAAERAGWGRRDGKTTANKAG